jgi:hypothetical protein
MNLDEMIDREGTNSMKWEFMALADPQANSEALPFSGLQIWTLPALNR